jgi:hypothetical protein
MDCEWISNGAAAERRRLNFSVDTSMSAMLMQIAGAVTPAVSQKSAMLSTAVITVAPSADGSGIEDGGVKMRPLRIVSALFEVVSMMLPPLSSSSSSVCEVRLRRCKR